MYGGAQAMYTENQIANIMVKQRFKNNIIDVKAFPRDDINTDHFLLAAKMRFKLKVPKSPKYQAQYDLNTLKESTINAKCKIEVRNKYQSLSIEEIEQTDEIEYVDQTGRIEKIWRNVKGSPMGAKTNLPRRKKEARNEWMTNEILELMKERKLWKCRNETEYYALEKEIRRRCREAKEQWHFNRCEEIEELEKHHKMNKMHSKVKELTNRKQNVRTYSGCIKDKDGILLFEKDSISTRWTDYTKTLYSYETRPMPVEFVDPEGPEILLEEVTKAIKGLKEKKAPGEDGITGEHLKALDGESLKILTAMINDIYNTGNIPKDLKQSLFVKIPKKPKAVECTDYRPYV